jgi:hypothetical protein
MSTPTKRARKPSTNSVLTSADSELISKIVSNLEKYLKLKSEENASLVNQFAGFKRVLQLDVTCEPQNPRSKMSSFCVNRCNPSKFFLIKN